MPRRPSWPQLFTLSLALLGLTGPAAAERIYPYPPFAVWGEPWPHLDADRGAPLPEDVRQFLAESTLAEVALVELSQAGEIEVRKNAKAACGVAVATVLQKEDVFWSSGESLPLVPDIRFDLVAGRREMRLVLCGESGFCVFFWGKRVLLRELRPDTSLALIRMAQALFPIDVRLLAVERAAEQRRDAHPRRLASGPAREKDSQSAN